MTADELTDRADELVCQLRAFAAANGVNGALVAHLCFVYAGLGIGPNFIVTTALAAADTPRGRGVAFAAFLGAAAGRIHELMGVAASYPAHLLKLNGMNDALDLDQLAPMEVE